MSFTKKELETRCADEKCQHMLGNHLSKNGSCQMSNCPCKSYKDK